MNSAEILLMLFLFSVKRSWLRARCTQCCSGLRSKSELMTVCSIPLFLCFNACCSNAETNWKITFSWWQGCFFWRAEGLAESFTGSFQLTWPATRAVSLETLSQFVNFRPVALLRQFSILPLPKLVSTSQKKDANARCVIDIAVSAILKSLIP